MIGKYIEGFNEKIFLADDKTQRAVCMTLINIGELAKKLTDDIKQVQTDILWHKIIGFRNIVAHEYETVEMDRVWETASIHIPILEEQIKRLLESED